MAACPFPLLLGYAALLTRGLITGWKVIPVGKGEGKSGWLRLSIFFGQFGPRLTVL